MRLSHILSSSAAIALTASCLALSGGTGPYIEGGDRDRTDLSTLDIQPNNAIDMGDIAFLLADWGVSDSPADFNDDGVVDGADLGMLLAFFGATTDIAWPVTEEDPDVVGPPVDCIDCLPNDEA